jgi:phosphoglycolate phosphatase
LRLCWDREVSDHDERPVVLFDLDGTVLDSAQGIIAAQRQAMIEVGVEPASEAVLRADLGPPPAVIFAAAGVPEPLIEPAVLAYRRHYLADGIRTATVYPGVLELLRQLRPGHRVATATMKRVETVLPFLQHHGLDTHFDLVGGARDGLVDKGAIIGATPAELGNPPPEQMIMIGDRHSDISGGREHGLHTIAVTWGYGDRAELVDAGPTAVVDSPADVPRTITRLLKS